MKHTHKISRDKFLAEMQRRGWRMDGNGWIVPEGRRQHDKEADWYQSIVIAIECECPHERPETSETSPGMLAK